MFNHICNIKKYATIPRFHKFIILKNWYNKIRYVIFGSAGLKSSANIRDCILKINGRFHKKTGTKLETVLLFLTCELHFIARY